MKNFDCVIIKLDSTAWDFEGGKTCDNCVVLMNITIIGVNTKYGGKSRTVYHLDVDGLSSHSTGGVEASQCGEFSHIDIFLRFSCVFEWTGP